MKILLVNKFHYLKGGSEKYYFELGELLKEQGHEVAYFSMQDEKNIKTDCKEYFVEKFDLNNSSKWKALNVIYNYRNYKKMKEAMEEFKPDIVHLNNFQRQLSSSIIKAISRKNVPIVFTAHDLQAICPAITMMDNEYNPCELCLKGKYINCIKKKCNKNSTIKSMLGALEAYYYRLNKIYLRKIDAIITPTEFYKKKLLEDGISKRKIYKVHNFLNFEKYQDNTYSNVKNEKEFILYAGRLSKEKGIFNLLEAIKNIKNINLYIAGDGPEKINIESYIEKEDLESKVRLLGKLDFDKLKEYIYKSKFVVVPSTWYENGSYIGMEAGAIGRCVIGSNIGGIPEIVVDNKTGLLFEFNSIKDLEKKIKLLLENNELRKKMEVSAKSYIKNEFSSLEHYNKILKIYNKIIEEKKGRK